MFASAPFCFAQHVDLRGGIQFCLLRPDHDTMKITGVKIRLPKAEQNFPSYVFPTKSVELSVALRWVCALSVSRISPPGACKKCSLIYWDKCFTCELEAMGGVHH